MREKILLSVLLAVCMALAAFAADTVYKCEDDSCGKCMMTQSSKKCGKCGGNMYSHDMKSVPGTSNVEAWMECERCGHKSKWSW